MASTNECGGPTVTTPRVVETTTAIPNGMSILKEAGSYQPKGRVDLIHRHNGRICRILETIRTLKKPRVAPAERLKRGVLPLVATTTNRRDTNDEDSTPTTEHNQISKNPNTIARRNSTARYGRAFKNPSMMMML